MELRRTHRAPDTEVSGARWAAVGIDDQALPMLLPNGPVSRR